jgi:tetratricopeptide (TPR) repeat protein
MKSIIFLIAMVCLVHFHPSNAQSITDGLKYLENENYKDAITTFKNLASKEPLNPIIQYYIGEVHYAAEDYPAAEAAYNEGIKINPKCAECNLGLSKLKLDQGKPLDAQNIFDQVLKTNKKSAAIPALIGKILLTCKKPDALKAIDYLVKSRDMDPKIASTWSLLGDAYFLQDKRGEAMTHFEQAVSKDPNNPRAFLSMARIWTQAGRTDDAINKLKEALKIKPDFAPAYKDLIELYIRQGKYNETLPLLEQYIPLAGSDIAAKVRLVKFLCFTAKDYDRTIAEGEQLLQTNPDEYTLHRWLAWAYGEKSKYQESYDHSARLFESVRMDSKRKTFASDTSYFAEAMIKLGKLDEAEAIYTKISEGNPAKAIKFYDDFAKLYLDKKNYTKVIEYLHKRDALKPLNIIEWYRMGIAQLNTNQLAEADSSFVRVLTLDPKYATGWLMRIRIAEKSDTSASARNWNAKPLHDKYIDCAALDPAKNKVNLINSYNYLGYYFAGKEDIDSAKLNFSKTLELDPTDKRAMDAMSTITTAQASNTKPKKKN